MMKPSINLCIQILLLPILFACQKPQEATYLFNGTDLSGWNTYLGIPDVSQDVEELERDELGNYLEGFGLDNDPLHIFSVVNKDDKPAIRIDGYVWGCLVTEKEYENYHLHLEYKWGEEKHPPRENLERNSGLCYHSVGEQGAFWTYWMRSFEVEIKETALGDFVRVDDVYASIETRVDTTLTTTPRLRYQKGGNPVVVNGGTYMVRSSNDYEKSHGQWNDVDLYVLDDKAVHMINGKVAVVAAELQQQLDGVKEPLTRGKIQLQSEGAEIFYRDIWIESIEELPI